MNDFYKYWLSFLLCDWLVYDWFSKRNSLNWLTEILFYHFYVGLVLQYSAYINNSLSSQVLKFYNYNYHYYSLKQSISYFQYKKQLRTFKSSRTFPSRFMENILHILLCWAFFLFLFLFYYCLPVSPLSIYLHIRKHVYRTSLITFLAPFTLISPH